MKRYDNLFGRICSMDNLRLADRKARRGKKRTKNMDKFDKDPERHLRELRETLLAGKFHTSPYTHKTIYEPKERLISILPYYPDRIVHHAIMNIMEEIWVKSFIAQTYSCVKGRGIHKALSDVKNALKDREGTAYCLKMDIRHFYPSIDHNVLKRILRQKIKDERLLAVLDDVIDSEPGVPIGNYLSQYFANIYLTPFDHWLKEEKEIKYYFRYADDMVILHPDKRYLHHLLGEIAEKLAEEFKLEIKANWQVFPVETRGIDYLGYVFRHDYTKLRKATKTRLKRRVGRIHRERKAMKMAVGSYFGWLKYCDSINLKHKLNTICYEQIF